MTLLNSVQKLHRNHYIALLTQEPTDWAQVGAAYGQIQRAWTISPADHDLLDFFWAVHSYQKQQGFWPDISAWAERCLDTLSIDDSARAKLLLASANAYREQDCPDEALGHYNTCLEIYTRLGDDKGIANVYHQIALVLYPQGKVDRAHQLLTQSLGFWQEADDPLRMAEVLRSLSQLAEYRGFYAESAQYVKMSHDLFVQFGSPSELANSTKRMYETALLTGDLARAKSYLAESLEFFDELGDVPGITNCLHELGRQARKDGDFTLARALLESCLQSYRRMNNPGSSASCLYQLALIAREEKDFSKACEYLEQARQTYAAQGNIGKYAVSTRELGETHLAGGSYEAAREIFLQALDAHAQIDHDKGSGLDHLGLARVAKQLGDIVTAQEHYRESIRRFVSASQTNSSVEIETAQRELQEIEGLQTYGKMG
ncbi:MAG: tetratricopeptide repeat protein [Caldilineaceae bacterium]|nr:tetratricopeptide repeat protein [Caldilineaceae bacterium]